MSNEIKVNPIDVDLIKAGTDGIPVLVDKCNSLQISNKEEYESVAVILKDVKARYKELENQRKEITVPLDTAKKSVMDLFRKPLELLESAERTIKKLMIGYTDEQERIAFAKQRELQRLAEIEAEKERKKLEAKIARAEASGKIDKVADLQEQKESIQSIVVPTVAAEVDKPQGVSYRLQYKAVVKDFALLPNEYKLPNQSALDKVAQATKGSISIPGVEFVSEKILASR